MCAPSLRRPGNTACCCGPNRNWRARDPAKCWIAFCTTCQYPDDGPAMIVPSSRLLLVAALVMFPAATLAGMAPSLLLPCAGILAACAAVSIADAAIGRLRAAALDAHAPTLLRLTKDVPTHLSIILRNRSARTVHLRAGLILPEGVASERLTESVTLPPGSSAIEWP